MGVSARTVAPRARVLVVDDERRVLDGLRLALRPTGYEVVLADSAEQALVRLSEQNFELVIADEHMPGESGSNFLTTVREFDPSCACVLLSGRPTLGAALRAVNGARVFRILTKPVAGDELRAVAAEAVSMCEARRKAPNSSKNGAGADEKPSEGGGKGPAFARVLEGPPGSLPPEGWAELSKRECEVVSAIIEGWRIAQIAPRLYISVHTVRNHLKAAYRKLDVHSQRELIARSRDEA